MNFNGQILYGNEWINYSQNYCKIQIAEDGIYRLTGAEMSKSGIPIATIPSEQYKMYHLGQEIPIFVNNQGFLSASDFIEFFGKKNRSELDVPLFKKPNEEMMNPKYSMFNDTSAYFLTWSNINGKRFNTIPNDLTNAPNKETYFMHALDSVLTEGIAAQFDKQYLSIVTGDALKSSHHVLAEGFASSYLKDRTILLKPKDIFSAGPASKVEVFTGWADLTSTGGNIPAKHKTRILVNGSEYLGDSTFFGGAYGIKNLSFSLPKAQVKTSTEIKINSFGNAIDKHRIAYITLTYPRTFEFGNQNYFYFKTNPATSKQYLVIENIKNGATPIIYNIADATRIVGTVNGTNAEFVLPASNQERELVFYLENNPKTVNIKKNIKFEDYKLKTPNYLIISNSRLYKDEKGNNWVEEYAKYRSTNEGGAYKTAVFDIEQIYDQYAYGIERHAIALRNLSNFASNNWNAKQLFLIGRGIEYNNCREPLSPEQNTALLVPTFGYPGADNLISANNNTNTPALGTGRIPVYTAQEVKDYLEKVKVYERVHQTAAQTVEERLWMKRIVHLAGGDLKVQADVKNSLNTMKTILENGKFAAKTVSFEKTSDQPVILANSDILNNAINTGVSMVNFFGHSSGGNIDYAIELPGVMQNKDRCFFFFAYGCYSGLAHGTYPSFGTNYVLQPERAAIGYISPGQYGTVAALSYFGNTFYGLLGSTHYDKSIGELIKESIFQMEGNFTARTLVNHLTYQGDPAIRFNYHNEPDYIVDPATVKITPTIVSTAQDNMNLTFDVANIGKNNDDTLSLQIVRELPNGKKSIIFKDSTIYKLKNHKSFNYTIPVGGTTDIVGENRIYITLDPKNKIKEAPKPAAEDNNDLIINGKKGIDVYILGSDVIPVSPMRYAIVNNDNIVLKASTGSPFAKKQKYLIEIDTSGKFNSPFKQRTEIEQVGGVISWKPTINYKDSTVYYWRITPDSTSKTGYIWRNSSFIYLAKSPLGWSQSHFYQFKENQLQYVGIEENNRKFKYIDTKATLTMNNLAYTGSLQPSTKVENDFTEGYLSGFFEGYYLSKSNTGVMVWVTNGKTLESIENKYPGLYESDFQNTGIPPGGWVDYCFPYNTDDIGNRTKLMNFLENFVKKGDYVALMTIQFDKKYNPAYTSYYADRWAADSTVLGKNIFQILEKQGAKKIRRTASKSLPYIFCYRKDDPTFTPIEVLADSVTHQIGATLKMSTSWTNGSVNTRNIGPASAWDKVFWQIAEKENQDESFLNIYGIDSKGKDTLLFKNTAVLETDISNVDAKKYPNLRLEWFSADTTNRTAPQLKYWRVTHKGVPEAVFASNKGFSFYTDTLMQGEKLHTRFVTENLSNYNMDSLLVSYKIKSENNTEITRFQRVKPLLANDTMSINFTFDTKNISGKQAMSIRINPLRDQLELDTTNNFGIVEFMVKKDQKHPLVDVLFDGSRIANGDIVSSTPNIVVNIKDENKFLFMEDTSLFKVYLRYPNSQSARLIANNDPMLKFYPASASNNNRASIELNPIFTEDGVYQLLVKAKDATGNKSQEFKNINTDEFAGYSINFEIISKKSISNVLNYPNPFSTSTQFVYTLTGNEAPTYFKIQILTITGRVVREITQTELGELKVGTHKTDYAWDGTDQYGDKLAAGVYLYKVIAKKADGSDFESHENENADVFFKNGIGKMVILR
jgi:hypothetical protein